MGVLRSILDVDERRGTAAEVPSARTFQWPALVCAGGLSVANAAQRPAALGGSATTNPALAARRLLRGDGGRLALAAAFGSGAGGRAQRRHPGQPHAPIDSRERCSCGL